MNRIACRIKDCPNAFETEEAVSPNASYICKDHPREAQVRAVPGRRYNEKTDEADKDIHFQDHQFDKDFRSSSSRPEGTDHIPNQGSNVLTDRDIRRIHSKEGHGE